MKKILNHVNIQVLSKNEIHPAPPVQARWLQGWPLL